MDRLVDIAEQEKTDALELLSSEYAVGEARAEQAARVSAAAAAALKQAAATAKEAAKVSARAGTVEAAKDKMAAKLDTVNAVHRDAYDSVVAQLAASKARVFDSRMYRAQARKEVYMSKAVIRQKEADIEAERKARVAAQARARQSKRRMKVQQATTKAAVTGYRMELAAAHQKFDDLVSNAADENKKVIALAVAHLTLDLEEAEARADLAEQARTFAFTTGGADGGAPGVANKRHRFKDEFFDVCVKFLFLGVPPKNVVAIIRTACEVFGTSYDSLPKSTSPIARADQAKGVLNQQQAADFMDKKAKPDETLFFELMHDATT